MKILLLKGGVSLGVADNKKGWHEECLLIPWKLGGECRKNLHNIIMGEFPQYILLIVTKIKFFMKMWFLFCSHVAY